ncbi:alpha-galactosidase [Tabrizicola sp. YIM 78059]|uniref:alpha-galactosidase n=1 Tax=Tabrizicola sp. YIM 78059 TaxID=2529861 RepID=UPI0010AAE6C5|nr:alpha-galactosidase [Tabrizicola sp. YIM 78059]
MKTFRIDAGPQTIALATEGGIPHVIWWGQGLPESEDLQQLALAGRHDLTGGMLDVLPALSLSPEPGRAFQGQPGHLLAEADGTPLAPAFTFDRAEAGQGTLTLISRSAGLVLTHRLVARPTGTITLQTVLEADRPIRVLWLAAPVLPAPQHGQIIDVSGKWIGEMQLNRVDWIPGIRLREARTGRSGHEHPPYLVLSGEGCTNTQGQALALHYAWSGGHRMVAEELPDGRRQIQFGHALGAETEPGTRFETAELIAACSTSGLNGIAATFQRDLRDRVVHWPAPARPRPVHYNCWEAVYFDHRLDALAEIATRAAALGAERFVLDDGWFGRRDDDTSSLGDWTVDRKKWPDGLNPLISHVHSLGMAFGLWFEPEMVNPDSDLFRAHPDWMLGPREQTTGRHQMVLNLSRPEVRENLFHQISAILTEYPIDYVKWDHNRLLPVVDASQSRGIYELLSRLRAAHPGVEIETCASGGGRIDAGILAHTHRVWLSDSNDALERLRIQHDAALFLPACITGSHVGPRHCHTSGRVLPMAFRAWVAAQRHMGFEMDLRELTDEEALTLARVTRWWKANRGWMMAGSILRLDSDDPAVTAELQLAADGGRFVVFAGQAEASRQMLPRPLRLTGLDPEARYEIRLLNAEDAPRQSRGPNALKAGPLTLSGRALMTHGIQLPVAWPATMWVVEGTRS